MIVIRYEHTKTQYNNISVEMCLCGKTTLGQIINNIMCVVFHVINLSNHWVFDNPSSEYDTHIYNRTDGEQKK